MSAGCEFAGNSDLYGAGIRYGIYMQWVAAQWAVLCGLQDSANLVDAYLIVSVAIMAALVALTVAVDIRVTEAVIMLHLFFGGLVCVPDHVISRREPRPRTRTSPQPPSEPTSKPRTWRTLLSLITWVVMLVYSSWFWAVGKSSYVFTGTGCKPTVFFFTRLSPNSFGKISIWFAALSIFFAFIYLLALSIVLCYLLREAWRKRSLRALTVDDFFEDLKGWLPSLSHRHPLHRLYLYLFLPASLAYSIAAVELMLDWNHVTGVRQFRSTGQLIPFVIGIAGLIKVIFDTFHERKLSDSENPPRHQRSQRERRNRSVPSVNPDTENVRHTEASGAIFYQRPQPAVSRDYIPVPRYSRVRNY